MLTKPFLMKSVLKWFCLSRVGIFHPIVGHADPVLSCHFCELGPLLTDHVTQTISDRLKLALQLGCTWWCLMG